MVEKQLLSGFPDFGLGVLALSPAGNDGPALEGWCATVEDEDGLGPQEQELADAAEETEEVGVLHHLPPVVSHRLHELHHPYARIDGESLSGEGLDGDAAADGGEQFPEALDSHFCGDPVSPTELSSRQICIRQLNCVTLRPKSISDRLNVGHR